MTIATIVVDTAGTAIVRGDNIARDHELIVTALRRAIDWLSGHSDLDIGDEAKSLFSKE